MGTEVIAKFENLEAGAAAIVAKISPGYSVVIYDTEAREYLPGGRIYGTLSDAIAYAEKVAR